MPGCPMPFGYLEHVLVPMMIGYTTLGTWHRILLLGPVRQKALQSRPIRRAQGKFGVVQALGPSRFVQPEMAFADLGVHYLAAPGHVKPVLGSLVGSHFWHLVFPPLALP